MRLRQVKRALPISSCPWFTASCAGSPRFGWLGSYRQGLVDAGVAAPPLETLWRRYRRAVLYGWVAATTTAAMGDRWQPLEVGMSAMRRATEACADLETVEAFREAL